MSAPTDPAQGPVAYSPVPIPESASRLAGEPAAAGPSRRPSALTLGLAAGALVVVGVGSFFALDSFLSSGRDEARGAEETRIMQEVAGPEHLVQAYLDALADGNARGAWVIASGGLAYGTDPSVARELTFPEPALLLDNASYRSTDALLADPSVDGTVFEGDDRATVTVSFELDGSRVTQEIQLTHDALKGDGLVPWRFAASPVGRLDVSASGEGRVLVNGVDVTAWADESGVVALPALVGAYEVRLVDGEGNDVDAETVTVTASDDPVAVHLGG